MRKIPVTLAIAALLCSAAITRSASAAPFPENYWDQNHLISYYDSTWYGLGIQKTMQRIVSGEPVRISFYGQSIIDNNNQWMGQLVTDLKTRYPGSDITAIVNGIGGCAADCLLNNGSINNVKAANPTLVVLYVYGWEQPYENLIKQLLAIQGNAGAAEVLILNDHPSVQSNDHGKYYGGYWTSFFQLELAKRYGIGLMDIRHPWFDTLEKTGRDRRYYLSDDVHLNAEGQTMIRELVKRYFVVRPLDTTPPTISSVEQKSATRIKLRFNEPLDSISATNPAHYAISGGAIVESAKLGGNDRFVLLGTTPLAPGTSTVTVNGLKDKAGNVITSVTAECATTEQPVWKYADIGTSGEPGSEQQSASGETLSLTSMSDGINPWKCEGRYAYRTVYGNCEIIAKVTTMDEHTVDGSDATNTLGAVMIRESDEYLSRYAMFGANKAAGQLQFTYRGDDRLWAQDKGTIRGRTVPIWLKLTRIGISITAAFSADGSTWTHAGSVAVPMGPEVTIGLLSVGGKYNLKNTAQFENISITGELVSVNRRESTPVVAPQLQFANGTLFVGTIPHGALVTVHALDGRLIARFDRHETTSRINLNSYVRGTIVVKIASTTATHTYPFVLQ